MFAIFRLSIVAVAALGFAACGSVKRLPDFPVVPRQPTPVGQQCPDLSGTYLEGITFISHGQFYTTEARRENRGLLDFYTFNKIFTEQSGKRLTLLAPDPAYNVQVSDQLNRIVFERQSDFLYRIRAYVAGRDQPYHYLLNLSTHAVCKSNQFILSFKDRLTMYEGWARRDHSQFSLFKSVDGKLVIDRNQYTSDFIFGVPSGRSGLSKSRYEFLPIKE